MKALKAMKLGKFAMKAMKAIMKALKAKKKAKRDKQKQMLAAGYIFDGVCPDTGIHWWIHPDDLPFVDRGFMRWKWTWLAMSMAYYINIYNNTYSNCYFYTTMNHNGPILRPQLWELPIASGARWVHRDPWWSTLQLQQHVLFCHMVFSCGIYWMLVAFGIRYITTYWDLSEHLWRVFGPFILMAPRRLYEALKTIRSEAS